MLRRRSACGQKLSIIFICIWAVSGQMQPAALRSAERICRENPEVIIICDEIGCGIVPLEKSDRDYRENVGRIMCRVVERAEHVERLICGIPQRLK